MTRTRRIIRKTHPARQQRVDDQLWPLVVAFCVLGGFLLGTVLAYLRIDDPRWYANAWTYLLAIPLVIAAALIALVSTGNRWLRRTMQLALVLGIVFHVILFIMAIETNVFYRIWTEVLESTEQPSEKRVVKVPDYTAWQPNQRQQMQREMSQPVTSDAPEPVVEPVSREMPDQQVTDVQLPSRTTPDAQPVPRPDVVARRQVNRSVPRRRDQR